MMNIVSNVKNSFYQEWGYLPPQKFINTEKAEYYKKCFFNSIDQSLDSPQKTLYNLDAYHEKFDWAMALATEKIILDQVEEILESPNIELWAMHFWYKEPHSGFFIPWHQDAFYWKMEPQINITAWIALGPSVLENGCLRLIPGTHQQKFEHPNDENKENIFASQAQIPSDLAMKAKDMIMNAGEYVIFNENTLHGSLKNSSNFPRIACSCRYTVPSVKFNFTPGDPRIRLKTVRGVDTYQQNNAFKIP